MGTELSLAFVADGESDSELVRASLAWRNVVQLELAKEVVVLDKSSLSFVDFNLHPLLVVFKGGKHLLLVGWDRGVSGDQVDHRAARCLETH